MPAQSLQTDGFVLLKRPPTDNFQQLAVFSGEHGMLTVLQRVTRKPGPGLMLLDLFDEATVALETSNQGRTYFLKEAQLQVRHADIGRSYDALRLASTFTALVSRNPVNEESRASVATLLRTALNAFGASDRPDIVYLKSLYRFARDEGYPLKEQWFPTLPAADRAAVVALINQPLSAQTSAPELVSRLHRRLEEYLRGHTDIYVDAG